jgi:putative membrane protein
MTSALLAFLHHVAAFVLFGVLMVELVLMRAELTPVTARSLVRLDAIYGMSAMVLLAVGFVRVFKTEKGAAYYFGSAPFLIKISLFVIVGLLSIGPTREFLSWRKSLQQQQVPVIEEGRRRSIRRIIHIELALVVIIMLCAALMARGIGFVG